MKKFKIFHKVFKIYIEIMKKQKKKINLCYNNHLNQKEIL